MLTNVVRAFCLLIDLTALVLAAGAAARAARSWRARRRPPLPPVLVAHRDMRVLRGPVR